MDIDLLKYKNIHMYIYIYIMLFKQNILLTVKHIKNRGNYAEKLQEFPL